MKILWICFVLILLAGAANGVALINMDSLTVATMRQLNQPDAGNDNVTVARVHMAINRAIQRVSKDFPAVEWVDTITAYPDTVAYSLDSPFVAVAWCRDESGKTITDFKVFNGQVFFGGGVIPPEDETYYFAYYTIGTKLAAAGATNVRPEYREPIVIYACYVISMQRGRLEDAQAYLAQYRGLISQ